MLKCYYYREMDLFLSEEELKKEFIELVECGSIEYNRNQFEDYINNCTSKNGQLEVVSEENK